jgi:flagellar hook-length control protein FliK
MSVVIAAPQSKPASPSSPADTTVSATESITTGTDFASLLLGQLAAGTDLHASLQAAPALETDSGINASELLPQDAASMLAALGMVPQEIKSKTKSIPAQEKTDGALLPEIKRNSVLGTASNSPGNLLKTVQASQSSDISANSSEFSLPTASDTADKAAKVAATELFPLPKAETRSIEKPVTEGLAANTANISPQALLANHRTEAALKVESPVRDPNWANDFSQKVVWLANSEKQFAQISLNPPQMGPIEITLNMNKEGESALFVSQNAEVREAIETALPRLREMLAGAGIELGQANVSSESFRQQAGNQERQGAPRWMDDAAILAGDSIRSISGQSIGAQRGNSLVDIFA